MMPFAVAGGPEWRAARRVTSAVSSGDGQDWRHRAGCRDQDPELFFPLPGDERGVAAAKRVCRRACPVTNACLEYALSAGEDHGVFGGLTPEERRRLARVRSGDALREAS